MGFIKGIFCEFGDPVKNRFRNMLIDLVIFTASKEIFAFRLHHVFFLFAHGAAHNIRPAVGITGKGTQDLHDLLLINDTAERIAEYGF